MPELPPWLTQQADPAGAFLRGAQGGAAIAQVVNQRNITQSTLRLNEQQAQMNHLKMEQAIKQRDRVIKGEFVLQSLAEKIEPLLAAGKPEMAMNVLLATGAREPSLFDTEGYPELLKHADAAIKTETTRKQLEETVKWRTDAEKGRNLRAEDANDTRLLIAEGRDASRIEIEAARLTARNDPNNLENWMRLERLLNDRDRLELGWKNLEQRQTGTELRRNAAVQGAVKTEADLAREGFESTVPLAPQAPGTAPGTAQSESLLRPIARPLTPANVTAGQKDLMNVDAAISGIDKSTSLLRQNPDAAGFEGYLKELYEGLGGQLGLKPGTRITGTRTQLRDTANQLVTGLRVEVGQMSDWERKKLDDIGDLLDKTADADVIITRLEAIKPLIAVRSLRLNKGLNVQPTPTVLRSLTDLDLVEAVKAGYLTPDVARTEYQRRGRKP